MKQAGGIWIRSEGRTSLIYPALRINTCTIISCIWWLLWRRIFVNLVSVHGPNLTQLQGVMSMSDIIILPLQRRVWKCIIMTPLETMFRPPFRLNSLATTHAVFRLIAAFDGDSSEPPPRSFRPQLTWHISFRLRRWGNSSVPRWIPPSIPSTLNFGEGLVLARRTQRPWMLSRSCTGQRRIRWYWKWRHSVGHRCFEWNCHRNIPPALPQCHMYWQRQDGRGMRWGWSIDDWSPV